MSSAPRTAAAMARKLPVERRGRSGTTTGSGRAPCATAAAMVASRTSARGGATGAPDRLGHGRELGEAGRQDGVSGHPGAFVGGRLTVQDGADELVVGAEGLRHAPP